MTAEELPNGAKARRARGRRTLVAIFAITLLPVVIAWALYLLGWHPQRSGNYGQLVTPARPLSDLSFVATDGAPRSISGLRGKWTLLYVGPATCPEDCRTTLHTLQQVVLTQGKDADRIRRVFLAQDAARAADMSGWLGQYPGLEGWRGDPRDIEALRLQLAVPGEAAGRVYLIDPLGNLILTYPAGFDASGMRKDLARLLRVSRVG